MSSYLFSAIALRDLTLANRIVIAPMHQYAAVKSELAQRLRLPPHSFDWEAVLMGKAAARP